MMNYLLRRVLGALVVALAFWLLHSVSAHAATGAVSSGTVTWCSPVGCGYSGPQQAADAGCRAPNAGGAGAPANFFQFGQWYAPGAYTGAGFSNPNATRGAAQCKRTYDNVYVDITEMAYMQITCWGGDVHNQSYDSNSAPSVSSVCTTSPPNNCAATVGAYAPGWSASTYLDLGTDSNGSPGGSNFCSGGCVYTWEGSGADYRRSEGGTYHYFAKGGFTGQNFACSESGSAPTALSGLPQDSCGPNQDGGTVNGKFVCINRINGTPVDQQDSDGDGIPDAVDPTPYGPGSSPGSKDPCTGIGCNPPDWTGSGGGGGGGGGGGPANPADPNDPNNDVKNFCQDNPDSIICKQQSWSGSCPSFTCNGDAVFCAIAQDQHNANCKLFVTTSAQSDLGNAVLSGDDPVKATFPDPVNPTVINAGSLDQTETFGATCIEDVSATVLGQTMTIPLSRVCPYANALGVVMVMCSLLTAAVIVGKG